MQITRMKEWQGKKEVYRNFKTALKRIEDGASEGVIDATRFVFRESYKEVPHDTGHLRQTGGHDQKTRKDPIDGSLFAQIWFTALYAIYVHEINKNYNHGKKWKYLEDPLMNNRAKCNRIIEYHVARKAIHSSYPQRRLK